MVIVDLGDSVNVYITYMHSSHTVTIKWSLPQPLLTPNMIMAICVAAGAIIVASIGVILARRKTR
ncbi:MAG: hypothetical protein QXX94_05505 [Candidatus Bathyarchaeia archaeon]